MYKEDLENLSPLQQSAGLKTLQISYSSIAVVCKTNKSTVLNCLKEIYSTVLSLIRQGNEISLDLKIGTLNVLKDNKLMFRNYNPDVVIDKLHGDIKAVKNSSRTSEVPTSVATPFTNAESTLSYRGHSQDVPARNTLYHVGVKRSGPTYQFNSDNNKLENDKLYYRHKKDPFSNLQSFLKTSKFEIESKIN